MDSSPTASAVTSAVLKCVTILRHLEQSASSDESNTLMAEFTSMLFSTSDGSVDFEELMYSTYNITTQTLKAHGALLNLVGITRRKKAILLLEGSNARQSMEEAQFQLRTENGLKLWLRKVEMSFLSYADNLLQKVSAYHTPLYANTPTGLLRPEISDTNHPLDITLWTDMTSSINGAGELVVLLEENEVRHLGGAVTS